jgi:2-haloacid dehalogenase
MSKNYEIILFDLDNTLFDLEMDKKIAYNEAIKSIGYNIDDKMYKKYCEIESFLWQVFDDCMISLEELLIRRHERFFQVYDIDCKPEKFEKILATKFQETGTVIDGVIDILKNLKSYYSLVVASNGSKEQYQRLKNSGLINYFDQIFLSEEIGCSKPKLEFYQNIFDNLKVYDKSKYLMVGDSIETDILGGIKADIDTCWYNPKKKTKSLKINSTYEIREIDKLEDILIK